MFVQGEFRRIVNLGAKTRDQEVRAGDSVPLKFGQSRIQSASGRNTERRGIAVFVHQRNELPHALGIPEQALIKVSEQGPIAITFFPLQLHRGWFVTLKQRFGASYVTLCMRLPGVVRPNHGDAVFAQPTVSLRVGKQCHQRVGNGFSV